MKKLSDQRFMDMLEKALNGISHCLDYENDELSSDECETCSYHSQINTDCIGNMLRDCRELMEEIKRQHETRVMTLEEAQSEEYEYCFVERQVQADVLFTYRLPTGYPALWVAINDLGWETYGELWRVWNHEPSEEQRMKTPWEKQEPVPEEDEDSCE